MIKPDRNDANETVIFFEGRDENNTALSKEYSTTQMFGSNMNTTEI